MMMNEDAKARFVLTRKQRGTLVSLLSIGLSCGLFYLLGIPRFQVKVFNQYHQGMAVMFVFAFTVPAVASLRSRFANAYSIVPICAGPSYAAAFAVYNLYFSIWEKQRLLNTFSHTSVLDWLVMTMLWIPTVSFVWLLGLFTGIFYLILGWIVGRICETRRRMDEGYRQPSAAELAILNKLLEVDFPERRRLSEQLTGLQVRVIDKEGSLSLRVAPHAVAAEIGRGLVAEGADVDADASPADLLHVHVLLHVADGFLTEMEVYKDDGSEIITRPAAENLIVG